MGMPGERLSMRKIREVLRLRFAQGLSQRAIGISVRLSTGAVNTYLNRARRAGLDWPLPVALDPGTVAPVADAAPVVPALIADAGEAAAWRYIDFFTANIRNPNTRRAYTRACSQFFAWCETRGLTLGTIRPFDVATYIESRHQTHSVPDVKQQLAAVRMLFDWLITGQSPPIIRPPPCAGRSMW
jgi:hypothetical protein